MAYCTLEDLTGTLEVLVFPKVLEAYAQLVEVDKVVLIRGRINTQEETIKFFAEEISELSPMWGMKAFIKIDSGMGDTEKIDVIREILTNYQGNIPVYLSFLRKEINLTDKKYWVNWDES